MIKPFQHTHDDRPLGYGPGHPDIRVRDSTVAALQMPSVDFNSLARGIEAHGLAADSRTYILHHGDLPNPRPGLAKPPSFTVPGTDKVYINTARIARFDDAKRLDLHRELFGEPLFGNVGTAVTEEIFARTAILARAKQKRLVSLSVNPGATVAGITAAEFMTLEAIEQLGMPSYAAGLLLPLVLIGVAPKQFKRRANYLADIRRVALQDHLPEHAGDIEFPGDAYKQRKEPAFRDTSGEGLYAQESESFKLTKLYKTYADGRVRQYGDNNPGSARRTEIDLSDGRMVAVHKNEQLVSDLVGGRFDLIVVSKGDKIIDTIELEADPTSSPSTPRYRIKWQGKEVAQGAGGDRIDLALADALLDRAVSKGEGKANFSGHYGSAGSLAEVIQQIELG